MGEKRTNLTIPIRKGMDEDILEGMARVKKPHESRADWMREALREKIERANQPRPKFADPQMVDIPEAKIKKSAPTEEEIKDKKNKLLNKFL